MMNLSDPGLTSGSTIIRSNKSFRYELLLYLIVEIVLLVSIILSVGKIPDNERTILFVFAGIVPCIALVRFIMEYFKTKENISTTPSVNGIPPNRIFARSDSAEFRIYIENLVRQSSRLVLIGTGLNILHKEPFAEELMHEAAKGDRSLEIYLADPCSPDVETRLIEEELGDMRPSVGQSGLFSRLETFLKMYERFESPDSISINLFTNYPTFALLIIDTEYFFYPYGYATLGNFSPVLQFSANSPQDKEIIDFLDKQYQRIKASSLDAKTAASVRKHRETDVEKLHPFAVYFIPSEDSEFYNFGSQTIGYNIYSRKEFPSRWSKQVGGAKDFGFHLTLCDALYFFNSSEIERAIAEVEFMAKTFEPFEITDLEIAPNIPDSSSISVVLKDMSGNLEALHHEFVYRIYRRAAGSNYSLGIDKPSRDFDVRRTRLMIKRYNAPYILRRYYPHFTLLSNITSNQIETHEEIKKLFSEQVKNKSIRIDKIAIMSRPSMAKPWIIKKEIDLG